MHLSLTMKACDDIISNLIYIRQSEKNHFQNLCYNSLRIIRPTKKSAT